MQSVDRNLTEKQHNIIMKKLLLSFAAAAVLALGAQEAKAQSPQRAAIGVVFDSPFDAFGVQYKTSFGGTNQGQVQVLFGDNVVGIGADYQYARPFRGTNGLGWYVGVGPQISFIDAGSNDFTAIALRPQAGLEFKIPSAPIGLHVDWKPYWQLNHNSDFDASEFSLGIKYTLR
ncbi:hypothetical protein I6J03_02650 [Sphingobacterium spiritivorum]|nr:hypothetical protein I6J03_02650 [Sphingobacterium spiritivorum]